MKAAVALFPGQKRPKTTGHVATGARVNARGQAEFEYLWIYGGRDKLPDRASYPVNPQD